MRPALRPTGSQCEATSAVRIEGDVSVEGDAAAGESGEALRGEPDARLLAEALGEVGEEIGEDFATVVPADAGCGPARSIARRMPCAPC